MASIDGNSNNLVNNMNTIDGLTTIYSNGTPITPGSYVPYSGATSSVDLNNQTLTDVNNLGVNTNLTVGGNTLLNGNITLTAVSSGTVVNSLGLDVSNKIVYGSSIPNQIAVSAITPGYASPLYLTYIITNSAGDRVLYVDTDAPITYNTNSKTLSVKNLSATSGTWTNTGSTFSQTLTCGAISIGSVATFPQSCNFSTLPGVGVPAYFLALDALNQVVITTGISSQPTITATNGNTTYYLTFAPNATTTASSPLYVDGGASLTYNAFSNTLTVPNASIDNLTVNSNFIANGTNTIYGYAPLNSPALTGIPTAPTGFAGVSSNQIATQEFVMDSIPNLNLYVTKTGTNTGINTIFQFGPTTTDSFEIKRNDGQSLMKLVQNSSQTMTVLNLLIQSTLQAYILQTTGYVQLGSTLQVTGNTTLSTATGVTPAPGNNSTSLATTAYVQSEIGNFITKTGTNTGINTILRLSGTSSEFVVQSSTSSPLLSVRQSASPYVSADSLYIINTLETQGTTTLQGATTINNTLNVSGNTTVGGNLDVTNVFTTSAGGVFVKSQYLHLNNASNPYLNVTPSGGGGNFFAQATHAGAFITDAGTGDLCINSRTGNIRLAGGAQYGRTNLFITNNGVGCQASSMFDFSIVSAGGWTDSNSLYITTGGMGGNNSGVGMGFSTALDSGLLCSIAPNVGWKRMTYKANDHLFTVVGNTPMVTINTVGLNLATAGYLTNYQGATNAGLSNVSNGDLIMFGNGSTQTLRFFTGANLRAYANNSRVEVLGVEHTVNSQSYGQYRMISNSLGVGAFWRNDDNDFYFLKTAYGDPYGAWDATRPFYINLTSGKVYSNNGMRSTGGFECDTLTAGINSGSHVALNGGNFFYMVGGGNQPTGCYLPAGFNLYKVYISTTGNQFGTNDQWWGEAVVRYNNNAYNGSVTTTASNNVQVSCDANGQIYCYCPGGSGLFYAWVTWQRVI
jgi:hypothetical protein